MTELNAVEELYIVCMNFAANAEPGADIRDYGLTPDLLTRARAALDALGGSKAGDDPTPDLLPPLHRAPRLRRARRGRSWDPMTCYRRPAHLGRADVHRGANIMISKGPYTYDPHFSQIRDVNGWSIANVPNPAGLGGASDADNGVFLSASWTMAEALALALTWLDNLAATLGEETLLNSLPNNTGGRVQMRAALEAAGLARTNAIQAAKHAQDAPSVETFAAAAAAKHYADLATTAAERAVNAAALASMGEPEELEE